MQPDTSGSISPDSHHDSDISDSMKGVEEKETRNRTQACVKKNLRTLLKGNDTR
ncbi:hypothetical protein LPTSP3_g14550 [Leptospira kobayashii]|uniref:Uncharacterized protein n=1 Tax=Leptospira kobayashii TaxID=1917830 RepID=A0ABN6KF59_9LEPT|nr:hypothetical protein LPTSP3_g14550 [Leptospira kobayashii]